jgi:hypothetical protein
MAQSLQYSFYAGSIYKNDFLEIRTSPPCPELSHENHFPFSPRQVTAQRLRPGAEPATACPGR